MIATEFNYRHYRELAKRILVAFFFGIAMTMLFVMGSAANFDPIKRLEQASVDMAIRTATLVDTLFEDEVPKPDGASPIIIIDVDLESCIKIADEQTCRFDRIGQEETFAAIFKTINQIEPAVIIIDIFLPPEIGRKLSTSIVNSSSPILVPMDFREGEGGEFLYALENSLCGEARCGAVEYRPAVVESPDGRARYSKKLYEVHLSKNLGKVIDTEPMDSIAFGAAKAASNELLNEMNGLDHEISYSLPSFALLGEGERSELQRKYLRHFQYRALIGPEDDKPQAIDRQDVPKDAVLIIGSSAKAGRDIHDTPLGEMAGMEVMANAIRSMQIAKVDPEPTFWGAFFTKLRAVIFAIFVIGLGEYFLLRTEIARQLADDKGKETVNSGDFWDRYSWAFVFVMAGILLGEFAITIWQILLEMEDPSMRSGAVDVIWPIIGVMLSALIAFAGKVTGKIEWIVERSIRAIEALFARAP